MEQTELPDPFEGRGADTALIINIILPQQFFKRPGLTGEKRLLFAALEHAVADYKQFIFRRGRRNQRLFREMDEWFQSTRRDYLFAFSTICDILDLDERWIRELIKSWREIKDKEQASRKIA